MKYSDQNVQTALQTPLTLWRSIKYEEIYLFEHATVTALRAGVGKWFVRYNDWRPHETLGNLTPAVFYQNAITSPHDASVAATPEAA